MNTIRGRFSSSFRFNQLTDYPPVSDPSFVAADGGQKIEVPFELPFVTHNGRAQRIARIILNKSRQPIGFEADFALDAAAELEPGDVFDFTYPRFGWSGKLFEVLKWKLNFGEDNVPSIRMEVKETSSAVYSWNAQEEDFEDDNSDLPDPTLVGSVGMTLGSELFVENEEVFGVLTVDVTGSGSGYVSDFEVQYRRTGTTAWRSGGNGESGSFQIIGVEDAQYDVRARARNTFNVRGPWNTVNAFNVTAFSDPPSDVTNLRVEINGTNLTFHWDPSPDPDLSHYILRFTSELDAVSTEYSNATTLIEKIPRPATSVTIPARVGTYWIRAVDKKGNKSLDPQKVITNQAEIANHNAVWTNNEHPSFGGTFTSTALNTDNFDGIVIGDYSSAPAEGVYDFGGTLDLGAPFVCRLGANIKLIRLDDSGAMFDSASRDFDDAPGNFDGAEYDDTNVLFQYRATDDNPSGSPTWGNWTTFTSGEAKRSRFRVPRCPQNDFKRRNSENL